MELKKILSALVLVSMLYSCTNEVPTNDERTQGVTKPGTDSIRYEHPVSIKFKGFSKRDSIEIVYFDNGRSKSNKLCTAEDELDKTDLKNNIRRFHVLDTFFRWTKNVRISYCVNRKKYTALFSDINLRWVYNYPFAYSFYIDSYKINGVEGVTSGRVGNPTFEISK